MKNIHDNAAAFLASLKAEVAERNARRQRLATRLDQIAIIISCMVISGMSGLLVFMWQLSAPDYPNEGLLARRPAPTAEEVQYQRDQASFYFHTAPLRMEATNRQ